MKGRTIDLLWTSGWDSTFRLMYLLFVEKVEVQPYYIIDPGRKSLSLEIDTMGKIKRKLETLFPGHLDLLRPTIMSVMDDIPPDRQITEKFMNLRSRNHLGIQYEWLARFAKSFGSGNLEICIEGGPASLGVNWFLEGNLHFQDDTSRTGTWILNDSCSGTDLSIFQYFSFPVFGITKLQMMEIASNAGFLDILNLTWFCLRPIFGRPCGMCHTCSIVMNVGLKDRIPMDAHFRYHLKHMTRSLFPHH